MKDIIQNIKDCGQSLIDNAEKIVNELPKYTRNLSFTCYPEDDDDSVYVSVNYDFIPEQYVERRRNSD